MKLRHRMNRQRGVALVVAMLTLFVLSALAAAIILATQTETWTTSNYKQMLQARYAAEAGAQNTLNYLLYTYTPPASMTAYDLTKFPVQDAASHNTVILSAMTGVIANYPDAAVQSAFSSALKDASIPGVGVPASYEINAKLLSMQQGPGVLSASTGIPQTWEITSQGNVPGVRNAQVQVVMRIERGGTSLFSYGLQTTGNGCGAISLAGGSSVDSFDSSKGTYTATHQNTGGNVASNGNMTLGGSSSIGGTFSGPNTNIGACPGNGITNGSNASPIDAGVTTLTTPLSPANPVAPTSPATLITAQSISGSCGAIAGCTKAGTTITLSPTTGYGNLSISGGAVIHLTAGTYNMNSLTLMGNSTIVLDSTPVTLNIAGGTGAVMAVNFTGGSVTNNTAIASNFIIAYAGSLPSILTGNGNSYGVYYAPNSALTLAGNSPWYGAAVSQTYASVGGAALHYDRALQNNFKLAGPYFRTSFSWSKF